MAEQPDLPGPTTSYSDPFYDRLESVAQRIAKRLWLVLLALVVIVVAAVVTHATLRDTPVAASAGRFLDAASTRMEAEQLDPALRSSKIVEAEKALAAVAGDEANTPYYRARAHLEIAQLELDRSALTEAKASVEKARALATQAADADLDLAVGLSEAAVLFQSGEHAAAETRYLGVERAAVTHPDRQLAAIIGAAQAQVALNRVDDAIAKLETLVNRSDNTAGNLLSLAKAQYWSLKRRQAGAAATPTTAPQPETPGAQPSVPANPPAAPSEPVAAPATAGPAVDAPVQTPVAPAASVAPQPAPGPEGK